MTIFMIILLYHNLSNNVQLIIFYKLNAMNLQIVHYTDMFYITQSYIYVLTEKKCVEKKSIKNQMIKKKSILPVKC